MTSMVQTEGLAFAGFVLEPGQKRVLRCDGTELSLTPRLFDALQLFAEHPGELLDKGTLMRALWPGVVVEENNLSQVVSGLRRALGDDGHGSRFIQTVPRRGFRFVAAVRVLPAGEATPRDPLAPAGAVTAPPDDLVLALVRQKPTCS